MKKLLLIGICLIALAGFASAHISDWGLIPELDDLGDPNLYPQPVLLGDGGTTGDDIIGPHLYPTTLGSGDGVAPIKYPGPFSYPETGV